jgi:hypothetical protein
VILTSLELVHVGTFTMQGELRHSWWRWATPRPALMQACQQIMLLLLVIAGMAPELWIQKGVCVF